MLFQDVYNNNTATKVSTILVSVGVLAGIFIGARKKKGIWPIVGYAFLFGATGAAAGLIYKNITTT